MPEPEPAPTEPETPQGPETHDLQEDCSKSQQMPASSLTLQVRPSMHPGVIPTKGRLFPGSLWAHDLTSASEAGDLTQLRGGCVTLGRSPNLSGPLFHHVSAEMMMSTPPG